VTGVQTCALPIWGGRVGADALLAQLRDQVVDFLAMGRIHNNLLQFSCEGSFFLNPLTSTVYEVDNEAPAYMKASTERTIFLSTEWLIDARSLGSCNPAEPPVTEKQRAC
jgi:hypothetical protein